MTTSVQEPRPIIPALGSFYDQSRDLSWLVVRATAGGMLLVHGITKLTTSSIATFAANSMARRGIEPAVAAAYLIFFLETVGAICIILGLFTRLARRDGKPRYLELLPRVRAHLTRDLRHPLLAPLRRWLTRYLPAGSAL